MFALLFGYAILNQGPSRSMGSHRVATLLRKNGIDTEVFDFFDFYSFDEIKKILSFYNEDSLAMIGFSASFVPYNKEKTDLIISYIKENFKKTKIVVGGTSVFNKNIDNADLYIEGFIEGVIDNLVKYIKNEEHNFIFEEYKEKKIVNCNKHYPLLDTSDLETVYVESDFIQPNEMLGLEFSRGCIFKCSFCDFVLIGKKKNDYIRSKESIKRELLRNYNELGVNTYIITDDTFNDNEIKINTLYEVAKELPFKLRLMAFIRPDLMYMKKGTLEKMVESGFIAMHFGIETFHPVAAKSIGKPFNSSKLKDYLTEVKSKFPNLRLHSSFIVGLPGESKEHFTQGIEWCNDNKIIESWSIYKLEIPADNGVNNISEFSKNWLMYGYKKNGISENNNIIWSNKHYSSYEDASDFLKEIRKKKFNNRMLNPWTSFSFCGLDIPMEVSLNTRQDRIDTLDHAFKTLIFVKKYLIKKIKHLEKKFQK